MEQANGLADEILARVWYVSRRQGFTMPYPTRVLASALPSSEGHVPDRERHCLQVFHNSLFAKLSLAVLRKLANSFPVRSYGAAELVLHQGTPVRELSLILQGETELLWQSPGGSSPLTVGILVPGECFGESVAQLRKASSKTTVRARKDLLLLQIDTDSLASLTDQHPYLTRELHAVVSSAARRWRPCRGISSESSVSWALPRGVSWSARCFAAGRSVGGTPARGTPC